MTTVLLGANYASGAGKGQYGSYAFPVARVYVGSGSTVPADIMDWDQFAEAYNAGKRVFMLSWKDNSETRVKAMLASIPGDCTCYGTYYHEPEDNIPSAFTLSTWRSRMQAQAGWMAAEGVVPCIILMSYTLNPSSGRNIADYMGIPGVQAVGWDYYPDKQQGRYTPAQMVALLGSTMTTHGVTRALIGEFGVTASDSQRITRINAFRTAILADGRYEAACYWSQNTYVLASDTAAAWFAPLTTGSDPGAVNTDPTVLTESLSNSSSGAYNTASVNPTDGARLLLRVVTGGPNGAVPAAPTISGLGITWTLLDTATTGNSNVRLSTYTAVAGSGTGAVTITYASNPNNCSWQLLEVANASGTPGIGAHQMAATLSTTPVVSLTGTVANSTIVGMIGYNAGSGQAITAGSGWAALGTRQTASSPSSSAHTEWDSTSPSSSVGWTTGDGSGKVVTAIEVTSPDIPAEGYGSGIIRITGAATGRPPTEQAITPASRHIPVGGRGRRVSAGHSSSRLPAMLADPVEVLDYTWDFADVMSDDETLASATVIITGDAVIDDTDRYSNWYADDYGDMVYGPSIDGTEVTAWLVRGPTDVQTTITCRVVTSVGRSFDRSLILRRGTQTVYAPSTQDPDELIDWTLDLGVGLLQAGETITDATVPPGVIGDDLPPAPIVEVGSIGDTDVTLWVLSTLDASVFVTVTTSIGRVFRLRLRIKVRTL